MKPEPEILTATHSGQYVPTKRDQMPPHSDFPFESIFSAESDSEVVGALKDLDQPGLAKLNEAMRQILLWVLATPIRKGFDKQVGRRMIALAWAVDPSIIEGSPSMRQLAKQMGLIGAVLSKSTSKATKRFGLSNRSQKAHDWRHK